MRLLGVRPNPAFYAAHHVMPGPGEAPAGLTGDAFHRFWSGALQDLLAPGELPPAGSLLERSLLGIADVVGRGAAIRRPIQTVASWAGQSILAQLEGEAAAALSATGRANHGKRNSPVGEAAVDTLAAPAVATWVGRQAGVVVDGPRCATYIGYAGEGPGLGVHLDKPGFGAVNLLVCLRRERAANPRHRPSTTFFFTPGVGLECFDLWPGDCLIFDGTRTPHGRSPLRSGDEMTLLSVGFAQG